MGIGIEIHPRYWKVAKAKNELELAAIKILGKHDLTYAEANGVLLEIAMSWNKYAIRHERHPGESDKKGDEA